MGDDKDHHRSASDALLDVRGGHDRRRQLDAWQVDDVFMRLVNNLGQRRVALVNPSLALRRRGTTSRALPLSIDELHVLLKDPHFNLFIEDAVLKHRLADLGRDGRAPVARADEAHLFRHFFVCLVVVARLRLSASSPPRFVQNFIVPAKISEGAASRDCVYPGRVGSTSRG